MSDRIRKVNSLLTKELSELFLSEIDFKEGVIATISRVKTAEDLSTATVWVQPFPSSSAQYVRATLENERINIQKKLHKRLHMKVLPKISFDIDLTGQDVETLSTLLNDA